MLKGIKFCTILWGRKLYLGNHASMVIESIVNSPGRGEYWESRTEQYSTRITAWQTNLVFYIGNYRNKIGTYCMLWLCKPPHPPNIRKKYIKTFRKSWKWNLNWNDRLGILHINYNYYCMYNSENLLIPQFNTCWQLPNIWKDKSFLQGKKWSTEDKKIDPSTMAEYSHQICQLFNNSSQYNPV